MQINVFGKLSDKQREAVVQIIDSTHYLTKLVNELLDEAQIESKTLKLYRDRFSPTEFLHSIETNIAALVRQNRLELVTTIDPNLPKTLYGDEQRLRQILYNLIGNAIKFTKNGEIMVRLYSTNEDEWAMQVSDTGLGIPKEAQEYIFEPFRQVDPSSTFENRGTGLGLSITKQLVDLMHGRITLESEVGKGSTFTIFLPMGGR
jgi:signal transduction histidine kinase